MAACIFSAGRNFLKIQYKPRGHPCETGSPPPSSNESLQPMATGPGYHGDSFAWQVAAATANHPPSAPSISSRLVCSACHWYDEPIAHSEKIFNHALRTRGWWCGGGGGGSGSVGFASVMVVVVAENRITLETPSSSPHPPSVFDCDQGRRSMAVEVEPPLPTEERHPLPQLPSTME